MAVPLTVTGGELASTHERIKLEEVGVSFVIPAYNEEGSVGGIVQALRQDFTAIGWPFEMLVVDDGSSDRTAARAEAAGARVLRHRVNRGYGAALKTGIRHARCTVVCIMDADGTYAMEQIPQLARCLAEGDVDMVVGARMGKHVAIPLARRPAKWALGRLAELIAGQPIPDLNSGLRVFHRDTAILFFNILPDGFSFTTTFTLAMLSNGYLVDYLPINYKKRIGRSKIRPVRDTARFIGRMLRIALYFAPLKVFLPISGFLFALAVAWGLVSKFVLGQLWDISTLVLVLAAVQVAVVGLLAELINRRVPSIYHRSGLAQLVVQRKGPMHKG